MARSKVFAAAVFGLALASSGFVVAAHAEGTGGDGYDGSGLVPTDVEVQQVQVQSSSNDGQLATRHAAWSAMVPTDVDARRAS